MFHAIIAALASFIIAVISWGGYTGIVILMAIESACIPLPSEIIMPFSGYLVSTGQFDLYMAATAGAIGCNVGSIFAYELGKRGGRAVVDRWGRYFLMSHSDLDRAERFFARWGDLTVLICRLLPAIRSFIAFPAGVARMPLFRFHLYTFIGSWPWCFGLAWVGMKLGDQWRTDARLSGILHKLDFVIVGLILASGIWFVWHRLKKPASKA
ncbi:DedA family protein [Rhizorhabdus dicambivorans]|uniref:DedA family protein n=1 Tax=Rhizorhabdus dicambivorans TaxID=1850238 RepID=A0A2A4FTH1_9SPHN|nr:DedA family protein [Rhizorhabdus dicambivorans]ATE65652.1 DedA family protein [Rhizorhabdus dicambivorans]PCE40994.1 DedA family protein [Rhizorhabdus dicambivorans]